MFNEVVYSGRVRKIAKSEQSRTERVPKIQSLKVELKTMPSDRRSDKGSPTISNSVLPVPLSRKPFRILVSSLGRDRSKC